MKKVKILLITPMLDQGGLEKVCALTGQLLKPYFDVYIAVFDSRGIIYDINGLRLIDLCVPSKKSKIGKIFNLLIRTEKLKKLKKREKFAVSYSFGPSANLPNILSRQKKNETWIGVRSYLDLSSGFKLKFCCKRADKTICCAKEIETELNSQYQFHNLTTIHNPFDVPMIEALGRKKENFPWSKDLFVIASMGRENDVKGFWHLIKSFSLVNKQYEDTRLMIIGEGNYQEYKELANNLGVLDKIFFTGVQKNPYAYLKRANLYVLSSLNEGFPNALVEAMALSIPVIATDCLTGPSEILLETEKSNNTKSVIYGKYGIVVPRLSDHKDLNPLVIEKEEILLSKVIEEIMQNEKMYHNYQLKSKERAEEFSYLNYVRSILNLI